MSKTPMSVIDARRYLQFQHGQEVCLATIKRWIRVGCHGVYLKAWKCGLRWTTDAEAIEEFIAECTQQAGVVPSKTSAQLLRETKQAHRNLVRKGFYGKKATTKMPDL